jgi:hypothetical protein
MGCCTSSNATKGKTSKNKKVLSSSPSATPDIGRVRSLSASDLDYMSDDDYGDSDSDNGEQDPTRDQERQDSSRRKNNIINLATYRFLNPFNRQLRHRFGDHSELKAGKVKLIPQSELPNAQTKDSIIFSSNIIYYKVKKNKKSAVNYSISKEFVASICVTLKRIYILTKIVRSKKLKVWKLYNKSNVNVLKLLFITSSRANDDLILHFTEDLGGDMYIKCEENKGELISVLETLHRVKLDSNVKVTIVKETNNELVRNYFRANRQELASENYHRTKSFKAQQRKVINDFNERLKITSFTPHFVLGIGTYGKSTLVEKTSGRDSIYYSANGNSSKTSSSKSQSRFDKLYVLKDFRIKDENDDGSDDDDAELGDDDDIVFTNTRQRQAKQENTKMPSIDQDSINDELNLLRSLSHPFVAKFRGDFTVNAPKRHYFVFDYYAGGTLRMMLKNTKNGTYDGTGNMYFRIPERNACAYFA